MVCHIKTALVRVAQGIEMEATESKEKWWEIFEAAKTTEEE